MKSYIKQMFAASALVVALMLGSCGKAAAGDNSAAATDSTTIDTMAQIDTTSVTVKVETSMGSFTVLLYGDTPHHRDNFVKLAKEGYYNGTLFHRVIKNFMIQAGDPDSKNAAPGQRLGAGDPGYTLEAEILFPRHFHKRGALAAARQGDQVNPERRSSGSQFYVVTGEKIPAAALPQLKSRLKNQQMQGIFNSLAAAHIDEIRQMQAAGDQAGLQALQQQLIAETEAAAAKDSVTITHEMEQAYTTVGGAPHLDGQYTVFGEVIDGMDVIDRIEKVATDSADRPTEDVKILSVTVIK